MRFSRRLELRADPDLLQRVDVFAERSGLSRSAALRSLVARGMGGADVDSSEEGRVALAALIASEHVLQVLEVLLPGGRDRSDALRATAAEAAERRLEELGREAQV